MAAESSREPAWILSHWLEADEPDMDRLALELVTTAESRGVKLTGESGWLTALTKQVLWTEHQAALRRYLARQVIEDSPGRSGSRARSAPTFSRAEPDLRAEAGLEDAITALHSKGLSAAEIIDRIEDAYGTVVPRALVSTVASRIGDEVAVWLTRRLEGIYPVVVIDAIAVKIRSASAPGALAYVAVGVNLDGGRDVLGVWCEHAEATPDRWLEMLAELRERGLLDACIVCCDGDQGLVEAVAATWPCATLLTGVVSLLRESLRFSAPKHWQKITTRIRAIYCASDIDAASVELEVLTSIWGDTYPAMIQVWREGWTKFRPLFNLPREVRELVYLANAIESLKLRMGSAVRRRGDFPDQQAVLNALYVAARQRGTASHGFDRNPIGRVRNWKAILNALTMTYGDRLNPPRV